MYIERLQYDVVMATPSLVITDGNLESVHFAL